MSALGRQGCLLCVLLAGSGAGLDQERTFVLTEADKGRTQHHAGKPLGLAGAVLSQLSLGL